MFPLRLKASAVPVGKQTFRTLAATFKVFVVTIQAAQESRAQFDLSSLFRKKEKKKERKNKNKTTNKLWEISILSFYSREFLQDLLVIKLRETLTGLTLWQCLFSACIR